MIIALLLQLVLVPLHIAGSHHDHVELDGKISASPVHPAGDHHHHNHDDGDGQHSSNDHVLAVAPSQAPVALHAVAWVAPAPAVSLPELLPSRCLLAGSSGQAPDTGPPLRPSARGPPMA